MSYHIDIRGDRNWVFVGIMGSIAATILGALIWWGYASYSRSRNEEAQLALATQIDRFTRAAADGTTTIASWTALYQEFSAAATIYRSSSLAAFFHIYAAEALLRATDYHNRMALLYETLDAALALLDPHSIYYYLYATKRAALALNDTSEAEHAQGRRMLLTLAQNAENICNSLSWYYLWEYGMAHNDQELIGLAAPKLRTDKTLSSLVAE